MKTDKRLERSPVVSGDPLVMRSQVLMLSRVESLSGSPPTTAALIRAWGTREGWLAACAGRCSAEPSKPPPG